MEVAAPLADNSRVVTMTFFSQFPDFLISVLLAKIPVKDLLIIETDSANRESLDIKYKFKRGSNVAEVTFRSLTGEEDLKITIKPRFFSFFDIISHLYGSVESSAQQGSRILAESQFDLNNS